MNKIRLIRELEKRPLFTFNEFVRITGKESGYARVLAHRLKKDHFIFQVEKGKYTVFDNPLIFSSYLQTPSYISFWTAIRFHGLTEQLPTDVMVAVPKPKKTILFKGTRIRFFKTKHLWGYKKTRYMDFDIFMAEKEKCIIDSMLIKNTPFDEVIKAMKTGEFNKQKMLDYADRTKNKSLIKRIGCLMQHFGADANKLTKSIDNNYIRLDSDGSWKGRKIRKWKIILNRRLDDKH